MAIYHDIAQRLRDRIHNGEFRIGDRLPSISELQAQYDITSLNTIRAAQQLLVRDGLIETRQGSGAFVIRTRPLTEVDVTGEITAARDQLTHVLAALAAPQPVVRIHLDDPAREDTYSVLSEALRDYAHNERFEAEKDREDGADMLADRRLRQAEEADRLLDCIEAALNQ